MTDGPTRTETPEDGRTPRVVVGGIAVAVGLVATAMLVPAVTGWDVHVKSFPPLHARWDPRVGAGTIPALLIALLGTTQALGVAARASWGRLLALAYATGVGWMLALAFVDGSDGVGHILDTNYEYLQTARATTDLPATLAIYVERIPFDAPLGNWPVHIAGHPPGALTFFVGLDRIGLGNGFAAGLVVTLVAASTALAVLTTMRVLGAEALARRAAPFLVLGPAAVWQCVSADGMFAAVVAWGIAALALAATARRAVPMLAWSVVAGLLLGYAVMLSYGLPLTGVLAVAVLAVARSWRPLVPAALAAVAVVALYAALGFAWWEAIGVLHERYWDGVAHVRPGGYWIWGNLAALSVSAGPAIGAAVALTARRVRARRVASGSAPGTGAAGDAERALLWLVGAGVTMVLLADASQMSRAEVERIWLPFVPWILIGCALLPQRWRRPVLTVQVGAALVVQHLLFTGW